MPRQPSSSSSSSGAGQEQAVYPLSKITVYRNEDGTGQIATNYSYTWHSCTLQILQRTTTLPAVPVEQGGSGVAATRTERFDTKGNLVWLKDERGFITYHVYDVVKGVVTKTIEDVDGTKLTLPSGWSTPSGGGLHLVTDYEHDALGRTVQTLGPEHTAVVDGSATTVRTASWTVYKDAARETRSANGFATLGSSSSSSSGSSAAPDYAYTLVNPVSIQKRNAAGTRSESITATRASTAGKLSASDSFAQSSYVRWSVTIGNTLGQTTATRQYHTIPSSGDGSSGTNYDETTYGYDAYGRQNKVKTPGGTITRTVFDAFGRAACTYVGTDDSGATDADPSAGREPCSSGPYPPSSSSSSSSSSGPGNNMVLVTENVYAGAGGCSGCGGGGSGQLLQTNQFVDAQSYRVTELLYDWRNRQEFVLADADDQGRFTFGRSQYDNLDRVVRGERYHDVHGDGPDPDGGIHPDDVLLARSESFHDDRGQVYMTKTYAVDPATGTVGSALAGYAWFDAAGSPIKQQPPGAKLFTKTTYDSLGRVYETFTGYDASEPLPTPLGSSSSSSSSSSGPTSYDCATTVDGDTILEQSRTDYDATGNVLLSTLWRRLHNATGTGRLNDPSGSQPRGRRSYAASWYDAIGRSIASANYGTNGGSSLTRPDAVPARSDTVLVTSTEFNSAGQAFKTTDPMGKVSVVDFDQQGRGVRTIRNWVSASSSSSSSSGCAGSDVNVTVESTYTADGTVATLTAKNTVTGDQTTKYVYGTTLSDSTIARADLLRAVIYPDSDDTASPLGNGTDGVYDRVEYKYNRQGQRTEQKDQNATVHVYDYDKLGRLLHDRATTLGTGIDGTVRRLSTSYEVRGMLAKATSYDNPTVGSGSAANEVLFEYDTLALAVKEYQEHAGAKGANTPYVGYNYDTSSAGGLFTKGSRPTSLRYPNGRLVHYDYASSGSTADAVNRIDAIKDNSGGSPGATLAAYSYLGHGGIIQVDYQEPDIRYDLAFGAGNDPYDGLDRFDRVVDLLWRNYGTSTDVVRIKHGYDRAGNRLWREDPVAAANSKNFDELYSYDGVYQLRTLDRGDLNANHDAVTSKAFAEDWSLDATGNWCRYRKDDDGNGTWELDQTRDHDKANEITQIAGSSSHVAHDRCGNMTRVPKPDDWNAHFDLTYDAWNRLVKVMDGQTTVAEYAYDARNFRVKKTASGTTRHFYYNSGWQCLEERLGSSTYADRQFVWGERYIDDLVLRDRNADGNTGTGNLGLTGSGLEERLYCHQDPNWNVVAITSTSGTAQERYTYDAYGRAVILTSTFSARASSTCDWEHRYTGRRFDSESEGHQYRHRDYDRQLGRFRSADAIGSNKDAYVYCGDSPVGAVDPEGLEWKPLGKSPYDHDLWQATRDGDDLRALARVVGNRQEDNWVCIWPILSPPIPWFPGPWPGLSLGSMLRHWLFYPRARACAVADVGNITVRGGNLIKIMPHGSDGYLRAVRVMLHPDMSWENGIDAASFIREKSGQGDNPIGQMVVGAHSDGGIQVGDRSGKRLFQASDLAKVATVRNNRSNSLFTAIRRIGPPKCWFTTDATVHGIGCHTSAWAADWAAKVLRKGTEAFGTNIYVAGGVLGGGGAVLYWSRGRGRGDWPNAYPGRVATSLAEMLNLPGGRWGGWVRHRGTQ